jgi:hypothetical protein
MENDPVCVATVTIRRYGDAYVARCARKSASSTSAPEFAAAAVAAKHFMMLPRNIRLHPNTDGSFLAMPLANAPVDWQSATAISRAWMERAMRRV